MQCVRDVTEARAMAVVTDPDKPQSIQDKPGAQPSHQRRRNPTALAEETSSHNAGLNGAHKRKQVPNRDWKYRVLSLKDWSRTRTAYKLGQSRRHEDGTC